jgi:peptidyl-prolyl cis-trans isomerase C
MMLAALFVLVAGCSDKGEQEGLPGQESAIGSEEGGKMAVMVNGREILEEEVSKEVGRLLSQLSGRIDPQQLESMKGMIRQQAVDNIINRMLLEQEAEKAKVEVTQEEIDARAGQVKGGFSTPEAFNEQLAATGLTEAGFMQEVELAIRIEKLLEQKTSVLEKTGDDEARGFYDENIERFKQAEQVEASHILLRIEETDTDAVKAEKKQKIEDLLVQARGGADFAELAREHSDCPSKTRDGELGLFPRGQMVGEFEDAAFSLEVGQISEVVETQFGYHIIKLTDRKAASTVPFDDSKPDIIAFMDNQKQQQAVASFIDSLRADATILYPDTSSAQ